MAVKASLVSEVVRGAPLGVITLSGTVTVSEVGVARTIRAYRKGSYQTPSETTSDSSGNWSLDVIGGTNDEFIIICFGEPGENSKVFDHVVG